MNPMIQTILISAVVSGVVVFLFQQWIRAKMSRLESRIKQEQSFGVLSHKLLVDSYKHVWKGLIKIEAFVSFGLQHEVKTGTIDTERSIIPKIYWDFRSEMLFLPDVIYEDTDRLIHSTVRNYNGLIRVIKEYNEDLEQNSILSDSETLVYTERINEKLSKVFEEYRTGISQLRIKYRKISRDIFINRSPEITSR